MINRKTKEPVKLRRKSLAGGNISLYLNIYVNGKRDYKYCPNICPTKIFYLTL